MARKTSTKKMRGKSQASLPESPVYKPNIYFKPRKG